MKKRLCLWMHCQDGVLYDPGRGTIHSSGIGRYRAHLIEAARPIMHEMIQEATGVKVLSMHHDISTVTGEEVVLFTLVESPDCRQTKNR